MAHFELQRFISEAANTVRHLSAGRELGVLKLPVCKWTLRLYSLSSVKCCSVHVSSCEGLLLIPLAHLERGFYFSSHFKWLIHVSMVYVHKRNPLITLFPTVHRHSLCIALSTIKFHHCHHWKLSSGVPLIMRELIPLLTVFGWCGRMGCVTSQKYIFPEGWKEWCMQLSGLATLVTCYEVLGFFH